MKSSSAWVFGMIFMVGFVFLALNNFEIGTLIICKKEETKGKIVEVIPSYGIKGKIVRKVSYIYLVNGKCYQDFKTINGNDIRLQIGDFAKIEYSRKKPNRNNLIGFYSNGTEKEIEKFEGKNQLGYSRIQLKENIFKLAEYSSSGILITELFGEYVAKNDTLYMKPYKIEGKNTDCVDFKYFRIHLNNSMEMIDLNTNEKLYKIK